MCRVRGCKDCTASLPVDEDYEAHLKTLCPVQERRYPNILALSVAVLTCMPGRRGCLPWEAPDVSKEEAKTLGEKGKDVDGDGEDTKPE